MYYWYMLQLANAWYIINHTGRQVSPSRLWHWPDSSRKRCAKTTFCLFLLYILYILGLNHHLPPPCLLGSGYKAGSLLPTGQREAYTLYILVSQYSTAHPSSVNLFLSYGMIHVQRNILWENSGRFVLIPVYCVHCTHLQYSVLWKLSFNIIDRIASEGFPWVITAFEETKALKEEALCGTKQEQ